MDWNTDHLALFGRVLGDVLHKEQCVWEDANGARCQNTVPVESRKHGAICLSMIQKIPSTYSLERKITEAAKYMLCTDCKRCRGRPQVCAKRWIELLFLQESPLRDLSAQSWPVSISHGTESTTLLYSDFTLLLRP